MFPMISSRPLASYATALRSGQLNLQAYINETCDRIDELEPALRALLPEVGRRERLLAEAEALQQRFPDPESRPPLYGILFGIKDIFSVEGFPTSAGSQLPPQLFNGPEASCVTTLRRTGALPLGKTVTTEFAYFEPGPTRNPHNLAHTPGGSSSGSAAAVAASFCPLALGTQTIGSVIRPAAYCGVVGFKPSYGRIASDGVIPAAPSFDTVGIFTQDVAGIALAASLLCEDWSIAIIQKVPTLGVPDGPYLAQASAEGRAAFEQQVSRLQEAGYTVQRVEVLQDIEAITRRHQRLFAVEMAQVHREWFAQYEPLYRPRTAALIRQGFEVSENEVDELRNGRLQLREELEGVMTEHGIDLWLSPSAPGAAPEDLDSTGSPAMNLPWTHAGLPAITVPVGQAANGLPLGLQLVGTFMADEPLVAWARQVTQALTR